MVFQEECAIAGKMSLNEICLSFSNFYRLHTKVFSQAPVIPRPIMHHWPHLGSASWGGGGGGLPPAGVCIKADPSTRDIVNRRVVRILHVYLFIVSILI